MTRTSSSVFKTLALSLTLLLSIGAARADCWTQAGQQYNIDPLLLYSIAKVESSLNPKAINHNRNGTYDIGLMQINSSHLPRLMKVGVTKDRLISEPCTSVMAAAQILSTFIGKHGYTWEAVGAYNAGSAPNRRYLRKTYATKVWREYKRLKERPPLNFGTDMTAALSGAQQEN